MKKIIIAFLAIAIITGAESCKKKKAFKNEDGQASEDNRNIQSQTDDAMNDADNALNSYSSLTERTIQPPMQVQSTPCGASIDTNGLSNGSILINYDGTTVCSNRKRSGSIRLTIVDYAQGVRWKDSMAVLKVDYINYKVTRASDNKSLMFNGTHYNTNVVGGNIISLLFTGKTLIRTISGTGMVVTFDNGAVATWNINRKYTYTKDGSVYTCTGEGIGSYNGETSLENWGTTREGDAFTSKVETPVVWNTTCGAWAPVQGKLKIKVEAKEFELNVTLGVDASGNVVAVQPNSCAYGWKVDWTYKNKTNDKIFKYL